MNAPSINVTPVMTTQPPIAPQGNEVQLNMSLSIPESIFIVFAKRMIEHHLNQGNELVYFGASQNLQQHFNTLVATRFSGANLTAEQQQLSPIIESVWMKTKATIENELRIKNVQADIQNEAEMHQLALKQCQDLRAQGISGGRVFTERQARLIIRIS